MEIKHIEASVRISNHGRITIHSGMRRKYDLKDGDKVFIFEDEGMIRIVPIKHIDDLRAQSCSAKEMMEILRNSREEDLELENR
ncbi:MAG: AbrB/MazE/SpoVT family DNA-binding domain-containing protein [Promethearchaeota archaeon]